MWLGSIIGIMCPLLCYLLPNPSHLLKRRRREKQLTPVKCLIYFLPKLLAEYYLQYLSLYITSAYLAIYFIHSTSQIGLY